jgi:2-oxoglutarate ferredoxin oxidoreductase subunit gamma
VLGRGAALEGREVLQTQAYGAESRGSLTKSEVIISESKIGFPAVRSCDILLTMSQEATDVMSPDLKDTGTIITDSTNVGRTPRTLAKVLSYPLTDVSRRVFGDSVYANMIMLGVLIKLTALVSVASMEAAIAQGTSGRAVETNIRAFREGLKLSQTPRVASHSEGRQTNT